MNDSPAEPSPSAEQIAESPPVSAGASRATAPPRKRGSRLRYWFAWAAFGASLAPVVAFLWFTREERVQRHAVRFLEELTGGEVQIGKARFSLFSGIVLEEVRLTTPANASFEPGATSAEQREVFSTRSLVLYPSTWHLFTGRFEIREAVVTAPTLTIVYNADLDQYNWGLLFKNKERERREPDWRTRIRLRDAMVRVIRLENGRREEAQSYALDADAWPDPGRVSAYRLDVRSYQDTPHRVQGTFDPHTGLLTRTPFVSFATVRPVLPRRYVEFLDIFEPRGAFRVRKLQYGPSAPAERVLQVEFRDASFKISMPFPLDPDGPAMATSIAPYEPLWMDGLKGAVTLRPDQIQLEFEGLLNDAPCRVHGEINDMDRPASEQGMRFSVECQGYALPEGQVRTSIRADETVPRQLRFFLNDFDPHGTIDADCDLVREPGPDARWRMLGTITPVTLDAAFHKFPYRLSQLTGLVRFTPEGIFLDDLQSRHEQAVVRVVGKIDRPTGWSDFDVQVDAYDVPFSDELYEALPLRHRQMWDRFGPHGTMNAHVRLHRRGGSRAASAPLVAETTLDLVDVAARYDDFPYPLEHVRGRIEMRPGRTEFQDLRGRRGDAQIVLSGWLTSRQDATAQVELEIDAKDVPLNDTLMDAVPESTRRAIASFHPTGVIDVRGRIFRRDDAPGVGYDLWTALHEATLRYDEFPYAIENVRGELRLNRTRWEIADLSGTRDGATIGARGVITRTESGTNADVTVRGERLRLTPALRQALPQAVRDIWMSLDLTGMADVTTAIRRESRGDAAKVHHRTEVRLSQGAIRPAAFPVAIRNVAARVLVSGERVDILEFEGNPDATAGGAQASSAPRPVLRLSGTLRQEKDGMRGEFRGEVTRLPVDSAGLKAAMPGKLRDAWSALTPRGLVDASFERVAFSRDAAGGVSWSARGGLRLDDVGLDAGSRLEHVTGSARGSAQFAAGRLSGLYLSTELEQVHMGRWRLSDVNSRIRWIDAERTLHVDQISAAAYEGRVTASFELRQAQRPSYGLSLTLADADLNTFLQTHRAPGSPQATAKGRIYASLSIAGRADGTREGGGSISLEAAEVWELPVVLSIFQVINLTPDRNAFHDAHAQFFIMNDAMHLTRIDLQGAALSLSGAGTIDLRGETIDARLAAGPPERLRVFLLSDVVEGFSRELMGIRVRGPLTNPAVAAEPLPSVKSALEELGLPPP